MINFALTADESWRAKNVQKLFAALRTFLNLQEHFVKNFALRRQLPKLLLVNFLEKFITKKKYLIKKFNLCAEKMSLDEISNRSSGNDALTAEFCKNFSNELVPVLLDNYDSWGNFGTVGVTFRTGIMPVISVISGDKFIHMIKNTFTIIQSKTEINAPLSNICTLI